MNKKACGSEADACRPFQRERIWLCRRSSRNNPDVQIFLIFFFSNSVYNRENAKTRLDSKVAQSGGICAMYNQSARPQVQYTLDTLSNMLYRLMESQPFSEITVTALCRAAGVGRRSYYHNCDTAEDLVIYQIRKKVREISVRWTSGAKTRRSSTGCSLNTGLTSRISCG